MGDDDLADFGVTSFASGGKERTVFRTGTGPAVLVIAEMPGITARVADFGRRVASIGCTAVLPSLFGTPGRDPVVAGRLKGANLDGVMKPYSVLTEHLIDQPGQPTRAALDQTLDLFRRRLLT